MRILTLLLCSALTLSVTAQTVKSKALKLKYTPPASWTAEEFGGLKSWDDGGNPAICNCSGVSFTKPNTNGKMHVVVYPSSAGGLDSAKRGFVGALKFEMIEKYEKTKAKNFSFELRRSHFTDTKTKAQSFDVIRYFAKVEDHFYIIYSWQEKAGTLNSNPEKELFEMINAIEPL